MAETLVEALQSGRILLADGAMGTQLQESGLEPGSCGEAWNLAHPDRVRAIHRRYRDAGCDLATTNTFGASRFRLALFDLDEQARALNVAGAHLARDAMGEGGWVLGDVGPFGGILAPLGDADPDDVAGALHEQAAALLEGGADAILVETQTAIEEMALAVRAARAAGAEIVIASFAFDRTRDGRYRTMMGVGPEEACAAMERADADVIGCNCGAELGLEDHARIVRVFRDISQRPVLVQANAGTPELQGSDVVYPGSADDFAAGLDALRDAGATIIGGCCGTTPETIAALRARLG